MTRLLAVWLMVLKIINVIFYSSRRVVFYVPHVFVIELLVATTRLKQAETNERTSGMTTKESMRLQNILRSHLIWKVIIDVLRVRRVYTPRWNCIFYRKIR
jgi:hypothetical protein